MNWRRIATIATLLLVAATGGYQLKAHAEQQYPPPCTVVVPAEWGEFKAISATTGVVFEDKNGTLRILAQLPCSSDRTIIGTPPVILEIRRK